jgi:hypothetical protein
LIKPLKINPIKKKLGLLMKRVLPKNEMAWTKAASHDCLILSSVK